jgi:hypothetical protein
MALYILVSLEPCDCCNSTHEIATLSDIQAVLSDLGLVAVPKKDLEHVAVGYKAMTQVPRYRRMAESLLLAAQGEDSESV